MRSVVRECNRQGKVRAARPAVGGFSYADVLDAAPGWLA